MVNELAPIIEKALLMEPLMESIAVEIPTRAMIPSAMITMVRVVLSGFEFIESQDIRRFSLKNVPASIRLFLMQLVYLYKCTKMINKTKLYEDGFLPALFYNFAPVNKHYY
jgi:hypothetical protein